MSMDHTTITRNANSVTVDQAECLEDSGYSVIRFGYREDWETILQANRHIFGGDL